MCLIHINVQWTYQPQALFKWLVETEVSSHHSLQVGKINIAALMDSYPFPCVKMLYNSSLSHFYIIPIYLAA